MTCVAPDQPIEMPAVCNDCGLAFGSTMFIGVGTVHANFEGNTAGPCPRCGGIGHIPDGLFNFTKEAIYVLEAPQHSRRDLEDLARLLGQFDLSALSPADVAEQIEKTVPVFTRLAEQLRPRNPADFAAYLAVLMMLLQLILRR